MGNRLIYVKKKLFYDIGGNYPENLFWNYNTIQIFFFFISSLFRNNPFTKVSKTNWFLDLCPTSERGSWQALICCKLKAPFLIFNLQLVSFRNSAPHRCSLYNSFNDSSSKFTVCFAKGAILRIFRHKYRRKSDYGEIIF